MRAVHIHKHRLEHGELHQGVHPGAVEQTGDIDGDGTAVERQHVGVLHQRAAAGKELLADGLRLRRCLPLGEEPLEVGRHRLLLLAVVGIVVVERPAQQVALWQALVDGALLTVVVQLAALLAQQEVEVYLPVVVGERALG